MLLKLAGLVLIEINIRLINVKALSQFTDPRLKTRLTHSLTWPIILGMMDGNLTVLTIADPKKGKMNEYLKALPSRNKGKNLLANAGF